MLTVTATVDSGQVSFDFTDTGIGIRREDLPHVFDKFYRATDKRVENITGSGLGLAITREIVNLHGGTISVDSRIGKGSRFEVRLPLESKAKEEE